MSQPDPIDEEQSTSQDGLSLETDSQNSDAHVAEWITKASDGDPLFQYSLGRLYLSSNGLLPDNSKAAIDTLTSRHELGDDGAAHALNQILLAGTLFTEQSDHTPDEWGYLAAAHWLERAANQGFASAQQDIALMYYHGQGVPIDYVAAYMWSNLAGVVSSERRSICSELKYRRVASFEQIAEAQRKCREFVARSEKSETN